MGGILSEDRGDGRRVTVLTGELSICFISSPGRHMMVVCVHVCACVFIYARVCMCTCAHIVYPPVSACVCIHGHKYVVYKCIYARICICVYIYMHMCLYAHVCFCAFLCMCVPVASPDLLLSKSFWSWTLSSFLLILISPKTTSLSSVSLDLKNTPALHFPQTGWWRRHRPVSTNLLPCRQQLRQKWLFK